MKTTLKKIRRAPRKTRGERHAPTPAPTVETTFPPVERRWAWHYKTLATLRDRIARDVAEKLVEAATPVETHSMHPADSASDEFEHDLALAALAREDDALREIDNAIWRIRHGRYGRCELTNARIPAARLRAVPWCRYTQSAEAEVERLMSGHVDVRPLESLRGPAADLPHTGTPEREAMEAELPDESEEPEAPEMERTVREIEEAAEEAAEPPPIALQPPRAQAARHPRPTHPRRRHKKISLRHK